MPLATKKAIPASPSTSRPATSIQLVDQTGCGFRVDFTWRSDRFRSEIIGILRRRPIALLTSVEGTPDQTWPPSPPLQQVCNEIIDAVPAALAIGMAGSSHWSVSFHLVDPQRPQLRVEVACLTQDVSGQLSSLYRLGPGIRAAARSDACLTMHCVPVPECICCLVPMCDDPPTQLSTPNPNEISVGPQMRKAESSPVNQQRRSPKRWNYRFFWERAEHCGGIYE
jgi:hypothetical protein